MNILVCYDESQAAQEALKLSIVHAQKLQANVFVITSLVGGSKEDLKEHRDAENGLKYAEELLKKENIPCECHLLVRGLSSGEDIIRFANENQIDEIIIGIRKTSKVGKLVFGSTAQYVTLEAKCPVVTIR